MKDKRLLTLLLIGICVVLVLLVPLASACAPKPAPATPAAPTTPTTPVSKPIKIGALMSSTGPMAEVGGWQKDGSMLALDEAGSQVAGRKVEFLTADAGSFDVPGSVDRTRKMVEGDGICMMFTPIFPPIKGAIIPYLEQMKVPNLGAQTDAWTYTKYQYRFQILGSDAAYSYDSGLYAYDVLGYRTMTVLAEDTRDAKVCALSPAQAFKSRGGTVIQEQFTPLNTMDFGPYIANLKKADCFLFFVPGIAPMRLIQQYRQFGVKMPIISAHDVIGEEHIAMLGDDGVGIVDECHYSKGIDTPANKKFLEAYQKKYSRAPGGHDYMGYVRMKLALAALEATRGDTTPEKLAAALKEVQIDTPTGSLTLGPTRWATTNMYIVQIAKKDSEYYYKILKAIPNVKPMDESTIPGIQ